MVESQSDDMYNVWSNELVSVKIREICLERAGENKIRKGRYI